MKIRFARACLIVSVPVLSLCITASAGAVEVEPLEHDFGEVAVGASARSSFALVNYTGHPHAVTAIDFSAGSSEDFSLATDLQFPVVVETGEALDVEVEFNPLWEGLHTAQMEVFSLEPSLRIVVVSLQGTAGQPPASWAPADAEASGHGSGNVTASGPFNGLAFLLIPVTAVLLMRIVRVEG